MYMDTNAYAAHPEEHFFPNTKQRTRDTKPDILEIGETIAKADLGFV